MDRYKTQLSSDTINIGYTARDARLDYSHYSRVLEESGANPILFDEDVSDLNEFVSLIDGMLFTGGDDVAPELYGETPTKEVGTYDLEWDKKEIALVRAAKANRLPVLGNCRGLQVINVALGGTLYQDLVKDHVTTFDHMVYPRILDVTVHNDFIVKYSHLAEILGDAVKPYDNSSVQMKVNSSHHQGVRDLGEGLVITAKAFDGVTEGFEMADHQFFIAVQWHPEDMTSNHVLHRALIEAAKNWRASKK